MPLDILLLYIPIAALFVMLPGPDFALIAKISLLEGRAQGQATACGVALGIGVHTSAAMLGISAIIAHSAFWFSVLKYAGAAYLIWLGLKALRHGGAAGAAATLAATENDAPAPSVRITFSQWRRSFRQGFLTNALNPKAVILFMTFLPQFMDTSAPLGPQFLILGGIMSFLCLVWYVPLAHILGHIRRLFASNRFQTWLQRGTGAIFILFGLKLATSHGR